jgi:mannosyltransferase OCH1-like enzyme
MKTNIVPKVMKEYSDSWIERNPEYEYRFLDDEDIWRFIRNEFPQYMDGYKKIKHGAVKADFWRYLIIYKYGGVYADIDCRCVVSLKNWVHPESRWVTQLGVNRDVCHWLIITVPANPVLKRAAEKSYQNLMNDTEYVEYKGFGLSGDRRIELCEQLPPIQISHPVMKLAGPPILQQAAEECFLSKSNSEIFNFTQVVCVSGKESCQMNGNVRHDYGNEEYVRGLDELATPHYESLRPESGKLRNYLNRFLSRIIKN